MQALKERLEQAYRSLDQLLAEAIERHNRGDYQTERADDREVHRLRGKREGVSLALSYLEEEQNF
jgi:hypothetical protein